MNENIYAEDPLSGEINIFNFDGKKIGMASGEYSQVKVMEKEQKEIHEYFKNHKYYKQDYHQLKHMIKFPKFFPPVKFFDCADNRIYVVSHLRKAGANEIFIFDKMGKFLKRTMLKMNDILSQEIFPLIRIANGKI